MVPSTLKLILSSVFFLGVCHGSNFSSNIIPHVYHNALSFKDLPVEYQDERYASVYARFKASDMSSVSGAIMQVYKKLFVNKFPNEVIDKIFEFCISNYCLISELHTCDQERVLEKKNKDMQSVFPPGMVFFSMRAYLKGKTRRQYRIISWQNEKILALKPPFGYEDPEGIVISISIKDSEITNENGIKNLSSESIEHLQNKGLIFFNKIVPFVQTCQFVPLPHQVKSYDEKTGITTYCFSVEKGFNDSMIRKARATYSAFRSFNAHSKYTLCVHNRYCDFCIGISERDTTECSLTVYNREDNNAEIAEFKFKDYIENCFCWNGLIFVELLDKTLINAYYHNNLPYNKKGTIPDNHRIEIYGLNTKKILNKIQLPLLLPYLKEGVTFSLEYVDSEYIYLKDHRTNTSNALRYHFPDILSTKAVPKSAELINQQTENSASFFQKIKYYFAKIRSFFITIRLSIYVKFNCM